MPRATGGKSVSATLFEETQLFRQDWLWALLVLTTVPAFVLVVAILIDDAGGFGPVLPVLAGVAVAMWGPLVVFYRAALVTEVRTDGLYLKLRPPHRSFRHIPCAAVEGHEGTSFSPIEDYGGVGIRYNPTVYRWGVSFEGPKAYIVEGSEGVRIDRADARPLVVGTKRPRELASALARACG